MKHLFPQSFRRAPRAVLGSALATALLAAPVLSAAQATQYPDVPPLLLGAAWYPEQWPESQWESDLALMEAAHIHLARVGEFAWSRMEPSEGHYDFTWLDHAITLAAKHHIVIVLGTPTPTPPAWLTTKYPDVLRVEEDGRRDEHGNRQHFSWANSRYRLFCHKIALEMAKRYGHNPNVVGWQIDNEYANWSFDPEAKSQWHAWLKKKYGTIENLNDHWTTAYWSQTYDTFDEIPAHAKNENPALLLEWRRFVSETWRSYQANQIDAIRPNADKRQFITTNTMGWFDGYDHYVVEKDLDIAAWDDYVGQGDLNPYSNGAAHDLTRGFKQKNFWVMETQPSFVNWAPINNALDKGVVRDMAWEAIGHGADAVEYWQWRSALNGQEQYHGVLAGADGTPVPVYDEVKQIGEDFNQAGPALSGTSPVSEVAILHSYDSRWAIDFQRHNRSFDPIAEIVDYYKPLRNQSQSIDVIAPDAPLSAYKLVVAPGLNVLPANIGKHLIEYVQGGGNLVLGPRSGMKDEFNALNVQRQPGPLVDLLGGRVEQWYALDKPVPVSGDVGSGESTIWAELLSTKTPDTQVLLRYGASNGWLDNQPAAITRKVGKGTITYIGAMLDPALLAKFISAQLSNAGVSPIIPNAPDGVEVCRRTGNGHSILILINHNKSTVSIPLPSPMTSLIGADHTSTSTVNLPAYGVAVLQSAK